MPSQPVYVAESTPASTSSAIEVIERASPERTTTLTADPGTSGTTLAVTSSSAAQWPSTNGFKVRVEREVMLVTAGAGSNSLTVTRGVDGTTGAAHAIGTIAAQVVGVQRVEPVNASDQVTFKGRAQSFRTPGRAGTAGQKIFAIHNATSSPVLIDVDQFQIDLAQTAAAGVAPTIIPPVIRAYKFTAVPTNGTALSKIAEDSSLTSNSAVTCWGDASADGTGSATTLTVTLSTGNFLTQEFAPRILVVGTSASTFYEPFDRTIFFDGDNNFITLRALEGICIMLDYTLATQNPTTNFWTVGCRWSEYTAA